MKYRRSILVNHRGSLMFAQQLEGEGQCYCEGHRWWVWTSFCYMLYGKIYCSECIGRVKLGEIL